MQNVTLFALSDSTGQTAETLSKAALRQFPLVENMQYERLPRIINANQLRTLMHLIAEAKPCVIVYTLSVPHLQEALVQEAGHHQIPIVDLLGPLIQAISSVVGITPQHETGMLRKLDEEYFKRIEAIEFAIKFDDGKDPKGILKADVVLIGVSRTSKTPTCMYLAQNHGIKAGNIPLVYQIAPPAELFQLPPGKVLGLTIDPKLLHGIRTARLKNLGLPADSNYADFNKIVAELEYAQDIMKNLHCPIVDVSHKAVEETTSEILHLRAPKRITRELSVFEL
jgi:regulator of PEP synthase PpsR (kinase-PPPase family)